MAPNCRNDPSASHANLNIYYMHTPLHTYTLNLKVTNVYFLCSNADFCNFGTTFYGISLLEYFRIQYPFKSVLTLETQPGTEVTNPQGLFTTNLFACHLLYICS